MKISFTTMATPELNTFEAIEAARKYGFDGIDLRIKRQTGEIDEEIIQKEANKIKTALKNIELSGLLCYNKTIKDGKETMIDSVLECTKIGNMLGAKSVRVFTGKITSHTEFDAVCEVFKEILKREKTNIKICVQNHANNGVTARQAAALYNKINDNRFGLIFSPDQSVVAGENIDDVLPYLKNVCKQIYIADLNERQEFVLIGKGNVPFSHILKSLKSNGFDGYVTLKWERCWHPDMPPYDVAFKSFLDWKNKL